MPYIGNITQDFNVSNAMLDTDSVTSIKIVDGTIEGADIAANLDLSDNQKIRFGAGNDLQIYHDGSNSILKDAGTGMLKILGSTINIKNGGDTENLASFIPNGAVSLFYDNSKQFETTGLGWKSGDSVKGVFGTDGDLQIFHSGSNSFIKKLSAGTGQLYFDSEGSSDIYLRAGDGSTGTNISVRCYSNAGVDLRFQGTKKFETTSGGVLATGDFDSTTGIFERTTGFTSQLKFTDSNETKLVHGSNGQVLLSFVGTGNAARGSIDGQSGFIRIKTATGDTGVICRDNSSTDLRFDDSTKLETTSSGVSVTGTLGVSNALNVTGLTTLSDSLLLGDNVRAKFGTGSDLQIYHDGSNSYINDSGTGALRYLSNTHYFANAALSEIQAQFIQNGAVELYYDGSKKLETSSSGVTVQSGTFATLQVRATNASDAVLALVANDDDNTDWSFRNDYSESNDLDIRFNNVRKMNLDTSGNLFISGNLDLSDNDKLLLGSSDDLQIYHSSGDSHITNSDGNLNIVNSTDGWIRLQPKSGEEGVIVKYDGAVELYHDNGIRANTESYGFKVKHTNDSGLAALKLENNSTANNQVPRFDILVDLANGKNGGSVQFVRANNYQSSAAADSEIVINPAKNDNNIEIVRITQDYVRLNSNSSGIQFNSDTAQANALNDYEEGNWTPAIGSGSTTISNPRYTKIGNLVHVHFYAQGFTDVSSTTPVSFSGLPYTSASDNIATGNPLIAKISFNENIVAYIGGSTTTVNFFDYGSGDYDHVRHNNINGTDTTHRIFIGITYRAA